MLLANTLIFLRKSLFEGMSDPSSHPLMVNHHLKTRGARGSNTVSDDAPFLLPPFTKNDESE